MKLYQFCVTTLLFITKISAIILFIIIQLEDEALITQG